MSGFILTLRAKATLDDILVFTADAFGDAQAIAYHDALFARLTMLAEGRPPHGRPCSVLVGDAAAKNLLYIREGSHFIVFVKREDGLIVIDFIHEKRDLPTLIASLTSGET